MDQESGSISEVDPEVAEAIRGELKRERSQINLIASENYTSPAVLSVTGSVMTNKYAEGYPGNRYYAGCEFMDAVEGLARGRAESLFGADHANVQPHSGVQANMAVYFSVLEPGDTIMAMELSHGGHLSHGSPSNFSGSIYRVCTYGVDRETEVLDYEGIMGLAKEHSPRLIVAGTSSYPRAIDFSAFRRIADEIGAYLLVDMAHFAGLVAGGAHPDPVPHAEFITATTHKTLRGPRGGLILCREEHARTIDHTVFPGMQGGPMMHAIAAKAVAFKEASTPEFKEYARAIVANCKALAEALEGEGFRLVSGGTDTHLLLIDLRPMGITGAEAEGMLESVGITVNKNEIPFDTESPVVTSGIRLGTPAVTTRGMGADEMKAIAGMITEVVKSRGEQAVLESVDKRVRELLAGFPIYPRLAID